MIRSTLYESEFFSATKIRGMLYSGCFILFQKMYAICDLALNLVLTKTSNFILKDFPAEPMLPGKLFTDPDPVNGTNYSFHQRTEAFTKLLIILCGTRLENFQKISAF